MAVNKKALNLEMLKIAGFAHTEGGWSYPDGTTVGNSVPFFPSSLDECLKWLDPAEEIREIRFILDTGGTSQLPTCIIGTWGKTYVGYHKDIKVAFCLAIKELKNASS